MRWLYIEISTILVVSTITMVASMFYFHHTFKVFYSLDAHRNDQEVITVIHNAQKYVYFAVYTFTKQNIADALIDAKKRGLTVWGITDAHQSHLPEEAAIVQQLQSAGIPVEIQKHPSGIMHIKAVVTEKQYASGSYNWTSSATQVNDEILEVGSDKNIRNRYDAIISKILVTNE